MEQGGLAAGAMGWLPLGFLLCSGDATTPEQLGSVPKTASVSLFIIIRRRKQVCGAKSRSDPKKPRSQVQRGHSPAHDGRQRRSEGEWQREQLEAKSFQEIPGFRRGAP